MRLSLLFALHVATVVLVVDSTASASEAKFDCSTKPPAIQSDSEYGEVSGADEWAEQCAGFSAVEATLGRYADAAHGNNLVTEAIRSIYAALGPGINVEIEDGVIAVVKNINMKFDCNRRHELNSIWLSALPPLAAEAQGLSSFDEWRETVDRSGAGNSAAVIAMIRFYDGIQVEGNYRQFMYTDDGDYCTLAAVITRYATELQSMDGSLLSAITLDEVLKVAAGYGEVAAEPVLIYMTSADKPTLAYKTYIQEEDMLFVYYFDALTFEIVSRHRALYETVYQGRVDARFTNPHDPFPDGTALQVSKRRKAVPYALISDDTRSGNGLTIRNHSDSCACVPTCGTWCAAGTFPPTLCPGGATPCCDAGYCVSPGLDFPANNRQVAVNDSNISIGVGSTRTDFEGYFTRTDNEQWAVTDNDRSCGHDATCSATALVSETVHGCKTLQVTDFTYGLDLTSPSIQWVSSDPAKRAPGRRMEVFTLLNIAAHYYSDFIELPVLNPLAFTLEVNSTCGRGACDMRGVFRPFDIGLDPETAIPRVNYSIGVDQAGVTCGANNDLKWVNEVSFRHVVFHEYGHALSYAMRTATGGGSPAYCYAYHYDEALANYYAAVVSSMESINAGNQNYIGANRKFPYDEDANGWTGTWSFSTAFDAIMLHYQLLSGYRAPVTIAYAAPAYIGEKPIVGYCSNQLDYTTCDSGSFYRKMVLNADVRFPTAGTKQRYEVSRSFIEHISDAFIFGTQPDGRKEPAFIVGADDTTCGTITPANWYQEDGTNENVPMADDVTDQRENATIVPTETLSASRATNDATFPEIAVGPDQYLGQGLYFTDGDDRDVWSVFVRPGESVRVATATSNSDTVMEIYDYDGAYVGSNDDCVWPQRYSCVTFQNTTGAPGIYRIDVRPYSGAYAGNDKTYSLTVTRQNDDYSASVPHPVVNSTEWTYGRHEVGSDEDYFYGYMASSCGASCGLLYAFCGASIYQKMEIWQGGVLKVNTSPTANCASAFQNVSLGAGQYTIRVKSTRGVVGNYSMRFYDITDEGSTAASGQDLDALSLPGGGLKIVPRVLHGVNDVDWFKLSPPRGANIHLAVVSQGSSGNPEMTLYGPVKMFCGDGPMSSPDRVACESAQAGETTPLIYNDDGGAYNNSDPAIRFIAPWSGEYYMKVRNKVDLTTGYRLVYYQDHSDYYQPPYLDDVGP